MLRIKEGIDLKELEKYGYDDFGVCYKKYGLWGEQFFINKGTREITRIHPYSLREEPTKNEIADLADMVERI